MGFDTQSKPSVFSVLPLYHVYPYDVPLHDTETSGAWVIKRSLRGVLNNRLVFIQFKWSVLDQDGI